MKKHTVIGKHALILNARGEKELAAQIFVYDHIREVRLDMEKLEIKLLMNYDESYFRVYSINKTDELDINEARNSLINFYNGLINAAMKLTKEEQEVLQKKQKEAIAKAEKSKKSEITDKTKK